MIIDCTCIALLRASCESRRVTIHPAHIMGRDTVQYRQPDGSWLNDPADNARIRYYFHQKGNAR